MGLNYRDYIGEYYMGLLWGILGVWTIAHLVVLLASTLQEA